MKKAAWLAMGLGVLMVVKMALGGASCARPMPWDLARCQQMERAILASTVRVALHGWIEVEDGIEARRIKGTISHGTVVGGRFLVTHNHFGIPLSQALLYGRYANGGFSGVSVYRLDGQALLDHAPIETFEVVTERGETTVLDFGAGFFELAGVPSAATAADGELAVRPGMEVAQIDWDGEGETRVVWTGIETVTGDGELSLIRVRHFITLGASGGGVFLNGVHVGNNWGRIIQMDLNSGATRHELSLVALNDGLIGELDGEAAG